MHSLLHFCGLDIVWNKIKTIIENSLCWHTKHVIKKRNPFASDWLRMWRENFQPMVKRPKAWKHQKIERVSDAHDDASIWIYLHESFFFEDALTQRAWWQQKRKPQELKKQQNKSIVMSTIKMTAMTMPAIAAGFIPLSCNSWTSASSKRKANELLLSLWKLELQKSKMLKNMSI